MKFRRITLLAALLLTLGVVGTLHAREYTGIVRGSIANGTETNNSSYSPSLSANGRYMVFYSYATNLVPGDTNAVDDVFLRDNTTGAITRISVSSAGTEANGGSYVFGQSISGDGRYTAFTSSATNLVPGDTNATYDVFVRDLTANTTRRISVANGGAQANGGSYSPNISGSGRYVVFYSDATNLVPGDTNSRYDTFVYDLTEDTIRRVSIGSGGVQATGGHSYEGTITNDGRYVAFYSAATNLAPSDTNTAGDVFVRDLISGTTTLVSRALGGGVADDDSQYPVITPDGRYIAYYSNATDLVPNDTNVSNDMFVFDRTTGENTRVSVGSSGGEANGASYNYYSSISANGRYVSFISTAGNLTLDDPNGSYSDIFVHDRATGITQLITRQGSGDADSSSYEPVLSADGRFVAFYSSRTDLVADDTNLQTDVFIAQAVFERPTAGALAVDASRAFVYWDDVEAAEANYVVQRSTDGGTNWANAAALPANTTYFIDTGLTCNTAYTYRVYAAGDAAPLASAAAPVTTTACPAPVLANADFETNVDGTKKLPDGWTGQNLSKDKLKCNKPGGANSGVCGFVFKGSANERGKLSQPVASLAALTPGKRLTLSAAAAGKSAGKGMVKLAVTFADGSKDSLKLAFGSGDYAFTAFQSNNVMVLPQGVSAAKVDVMYKGKKGKLTVDDVQLLVADPVPALPQWVAALVETGERAGASPVTAAPAPVEVAAPEAPLSDFMGGGF